MKSVVMRLITLCLFVILTLAYACGGNFHLMLNKPFKYVLRKYEIKFFE